MRIRGYWPTYDFDRESKWVLVYNRKCQKKARHCKACDRALNRFINCHIRLRKPV